MKKILLVVFVAILALSLVTACAKQNQTLGVIEALDFGEKYLIELDYEKALIQFLKVIEIEPMNPRGYIGAAEAYVGLGRTTEAIDILQKGLLLLDENAIESTELKSVLDELVKEQSQRDEKEADDNSTSQEGENPQVAQGERDNSGLFQDIGDESSGEQKVEKLAVVGQKFYRSDGSLWYQYKYTIENGYVVKEERISFDRFDEYGVLQQSGHNYMDEWKYDEAEQQWYRYPYRDGVSMIGEVVSVGIEGIEEVIDKTADIPLHIINTRRGASLYTTGILQHDSGYITADLELIAGTDGLFYDDGYEERLRAFGGGLGAGLVWFYAIYEYDDDGNISAVNSYSEDDIYIGRVEFEYAYQTVIME